MDLVKGTVEIKVWLRVPELWMACGCQRFVENTTCALIKP